MEKPRLPRKSTNKCIYTFTKFYWNLHSYTWDDFLESTDYAAEIEEIVNIADKYKTNATPTLLDLGCATGSYSLAFAGKHFNVIGIDYAGKMIRKAVEKAKENRVNNVSFVVADFTKRLNFTSSQFDFVLSAHTKLGKGNKSELIVEISRVLKKGGYLLLVVKKQSTKKIHAIIDKKILIRFILRLLKMVFFSRHRKWAVDTGEIQSQIESFGFKSFYTSSTLNNNIMLFKKTSDLI